MTIDHEKQQKYLLWILLLYFVVYLVCAVLLQIKTGEPPSKSGTAIDKFTGSLLWMISIVAILLSTRRLGSWPKALLWMAVCAAAAGLAIDEIFEFHEKTRHSLGDDDYIKIVLWACAFIGAYVLYVVEQPTRKVAIVFGMGLFFQTAYLAVDMGDGDFFSLPFSRNVLIWAEEILETLAMQGYLAGLLLHLTQLTSGQKHKQEHT